MRCKGGKEFLTLLSPLDITTRLCTFSDEIYINHSVFFVTFDKLKLGNETVKLILLFQLCQDV